MKLLLLALLVVAGSALRARDAAVDFDHLRQSVVRIQSVSSTFDWFHPFTPGDDGVGLGSGWVVQTEPYLLFVTNEHVINDAKQVTLQLLLYGEQQWTVEVVSVSSKFDLALLVLKEPEKFKDAMSQRNITLQPLALSEVATSMGEDVVALGFPLGQDSLKISKGNIAGNEEVYGNICIQSTAPISPGSSGGPLLSADGTSVVGVNFAKATAGENINYVIPVWRVRQLVKKHLQDQPAVPKDGRWERRHVHVPRLEVTTIEANKALYELVNCKGGVFLSAIGERSFLRNAKPPVQERSFLVSVRGEPLDSFGMGMNRKYAADRVHFQDLLFMSPDMLSDAEFVTCRKGEVVKHVVSMDYKPEFDRGIIYVDEPYMSGWSKRYELFGDVSVMQMTENHIDTLVGWHNPGPTRWLHPTLVAQPRLVVNFVRSGTYASEVLSVGAAVRALNGHDVHTLEDFRKHFVPDNGVWTLDTDMGDLFVIPYQETLTEHVRQAARNTGGPWQLTPGVKAAASALEHKEAAEMLQTADAALADSQDSGVKELVATELPKFAAGPLVATDGASRPARYSYRANAGM